jgi:hypothetical protein
MLQTLPAMAEVNRSGKHSSFYNTAKIKTLKSFIVQAQGETKVAHQG